MEETIYYEVTGAGEPLVLSHGAGGNHAIWFEQVAFFSRNYKVVTWDQRSFGNSTDHAGRHNAEAFAADLLALLDHLEIDRAHLAGQSMGGWTTVRFALDHPDRVRSVILADTTGGIVTDEVRLDYERLRSGERGPKARRHARKVVSTRTPLAVLLPAGPVEPGGIGVPARPVATRRAGASGDAPRGTGPDRAGSPLPGGR